MQNDEKRHMVGFILTMKENKLKKRKPNKDVILLKELNFLFASGVIIFQCRLRVYFNADAN